jgi:cytochrome c oxidase assembly factor CtaG
VVLLSTPSKPVNGGAVGERPGARSHDLPPPQSGSLTAAGFRNRLGLAVLAGVVLVVALVPPLSSEARHIEVFEALQFSLLALGVPALVVLGAPWRRLGLAAGPALVTDAEGIAVLERPRLADRVEAGRRRHPEPGRSLTFLLLELAVVVAWRTPAGVDAVARHGWLSLVEALTLVGAGIGFWLELVESPPILPRLARPRRIVAGAVAMWTIWITAYLLGLSHTAVYGAFHHVAGHGLSVAADQALTTWVLWFTSLCAFLPVIFSNLIVWLRGGEDADDALRRLVRDGRRR